MFNLIEFLKKNTVHFSLLFAITLELLLIVGVAEVTFSEDLDGQEKVQRTQQLVRKTWFNDEICRNDQDEIDEPEDLEYLVAVS